MKSIKFFLLSLFLPLLMSCSFYKGYYKLGLAEVERPADSKERYGESKIVNFEEEGKTKFSYEDEMIKIVWLPLSTQFSFILENKTEHSIRIIWDEAVYVNENGSSGRVMHAGVKYIDRNNPQPPTVIMKNARIDDLIMPTDNVYYVSGQYGGWRTKPLFDSNAMSQEELAEVTQKYINKTVSILLPLKIEDTINEYIFKFKIEGFNPI